VRRVTIIVAVVVAGVAAVILFWSRRSGQPPTPEPPNLLLITLDTTRADRLGCYGYSKARTPSLDRLAASGVRFDAAYTPAALTLPSHASLLTATYPTFHGVHYNGTHRLHDSAVTLAELCRDAGFTCGAVMGAYVLHSQFGLNQGFHEYQDRFATNERRAAEVTDEALRFLDRHAGKRFFLWAHYFDPHFPREPPAEFAALLPGDPYDGEIAYVDAQIGRLMADLDRRGLTARTLVSVVADHGEGLLEREPTHGIFLYEPTMRVPLLMRGPRVPAGGVVKDVVSIVDVMPTLCELLGIQAGQPCHGVSLTGLMRGQPAPPRAAYLEAHAPREIYGWSELVGLRSGDWKYIRAPRSELYQLSEDPAEHTNVLDRHPDVASRLSDELDAMIARTSRGGTQARAALGPESHERLGELGYVQGEATPAASAASIDPKDRVELLYLHRDAAALAAHDPHAAIEAYRAILTRYPDDPRAESQLGELLMQVGRIDDAIACYERAAARRADSVVAYRSLAFLYLQKQLWKQARAAVDKALQIQPHSNQSHLLLSLILQSTGEPDAALAAVERSLAIDPYFDSALLQKGTLLAAAGRHEEAVAVLLRVPGESPNRYAAIVEAGKAYMALGRNSDADALRTELATLKSQNRAGSRTLRLVGGGY